MGHLWEHDHPYCAEEENFYHRGCNHRHASWADFIDGDPYADFDLNLLFRWDWHVWDDAGHELSLFWMLQRKGIYQSDTIAVTPDDEPAIRAWLEPRWQHMRTLWAPFSEAS